jgi:hypothetical protein
MSESEKDTVELKKQNDSLRQANQQLAEMVNMGEIEKQVYNETIAEYIGANQRQRCHVILLQKQVKQLELQLEQEKNRSEGVRAVLVEVEAKLFALQNPPALVPPLADENSDPNSEDGC